MLHIFRKIYYNTGFTHSEQQRCVFDCFIPLQIVIRTTDMYVFCGFLVSSWKYELDEAFTL
jgi:hypothetical protein